jgi:hexosaminidase
MEQNNGKLVVDFDKQRVQKIRVIAQNNGIIPDGKPGAGSNSWLFVDEISIE